MNDKNLTREQVNSIISQHIGKVSGLGEGHPVEKLHFYQDLVRAGYALASVGAAAATAGYALVPLEPTPEMIAAYLKANDAYWKRTDELPATNPSRWRQGTPGEATAESYRALLAAAPASSPTVGAVQGKEAATPGLTERVSELETALRRLQCDVGVSVEAHDIIAAAIGTPQNPRGSTLAGNEAGRGLTDLAGVAGEALGLGYPDWPADLSTFEERKAYQRGVAHARAIERELSPSTPAADFDAWMTNPYTKVLMRSVSEDYVPRADLTSTPAAGAGVAEATERNIPHGWALSTADFSVRAARGRTYDGLVFLVRDEAGRRGWHLLSEAEQKANPLYVSGNGKTFADALGRAILAARASTPQAASPTHPEGQA